MRGTSCPFSRNNAETHSILIRRSSTKQHKTPYMIIARSLIILKLLQHRQRQGVEKALYIFIFVFALGFLCYVPFKEKFISKIFQIFKFSNHFKMEFIANPIQRLHTFDSIPQFFLFIISINVLGKLQSNGNVKTLMFSSSSKFCCFLDFSSSPLINPIQRRPVSLLFQGSQKICGRGIGTNLSMIYPVSSYISLLAFSSKFLSSTKPAGNQMTNFSDGGRKLAIRTNSEGLFLYLMIGTISTPSIYSPYFLVVRYTPSQFQITFSPIENVMCLNPSHFYSQTFQVLIILLSFSPCMSKYIITFQRNKRFQKEIQKRKYFINIQILLYENAKLN